MRKLSTNALLIFGADAGAKALNFLAVAYLVWTLDPAGWGTIVVGLACLTYAQWLADFGLTTLATREMAKPHDLRALQLVDVLVARLFLAAAVWLIAQIVLLAAPVEPQLRAVVQIYLLSLFPTALFLEWYYQSIQEYRLLTISRVLSSALYVVPLYLLVAGPGEARLVPWIYLASTTVTTALLFLWKRKEDRLAPRLFDRARVMAIARPAATVGLASFFGQTIMVLPPLVLAWFYSEETAGIFGAAIKVVTLLLMVDRVFAALFLPALTRRWTNDPERMTEVLLPALRLLIVIGCSISIVVSIFAADILRLIYRKPFPAEGATALSILAWFIVATLANTFFMFGLIGTGRERAFLKASLKSGAVFAPLLAVATWLWGLPGTAAAMVAGEALFTALLSIEFRKYVHLPFGRYVALYAAISGALIGVAYLTGSPGLWQLPLYWLAFVGLAYLFKGLRRSELAWLTSR